MKTLKANIIPIIMLPIIIAFAVAAIVKIIELSNAGIINWNR